MKCQHCERQATFHITELTGPEDEREVAEVHLCENHAKEYLTSEPQQQDPGPSLAGALAKHLSIGQTADDLARLDQQACPVCGITFYEFRHGGRLGCPHDYICFAEDLNPLIRNIHGETKHVGKRPKHGSTGTDKKTKVIQLRREMKDAIEREEYERASELRDEIKRLESRAKRKR